MDDGRLRGDGRLGDDFNGGWSERDDGREDWTSFRDRVDREWRSRRAQGSDNDPVNPDEASRWLTDSNAGQGPADFSVSDYRERLLGGPGAELFGGGSGPLYDSGEFARFSFDKEEERRAAAAAADPLAAALPQQAQNEFVDEQYTTDVESSGLVRPYFRTRGRTKPTYDLAIEALISTSEQGRVLDRVRVPEHRSICDLCLDTRSVAEVAALLRLPLGVVRVLIGDVAGLGLVLVHTASQNVGDRPSIEFMERVLSGLRRI
ncbi:DUF742 domain-containing protein [Amycolatopsis azurea]|uniref:DUF742 domain-containing protein n=1 Tax=Amycolatopsis azurea DSM 43854 TaxID=1238180 RepID=M2NX43_9PSEU|nr:DUF742 domain-containing protein [Amycolatopsis azurea]EMD27164.1 hypothetical protein C791_2672 [Amycolatopsis azurea DSM 43854]OOC08626.1 hypothetical protein B0293_01610 [Amycolatopsis azurea DSM 43854]